MPQSRSIPTKDGFSLCMLTATLIPTLTLTLTLFRTQEFCAPWKRKRDEEAEKQLEAATALAQHKQRQIQEEEEALAARAAQAALRAGGELGMSPSSRSGHGAASSMRGLGCKREGKVEEATGLEEGQGGGVLRVC